MPARPPVQSGGGGGPDQDHDDAGDDGLLPAWSLPAAAAPDLSRGRRWPELAGPRVGVGRLDGRGRARLRRRQRHRGRPPARRRRGRRGRDRVDDGWRGHRHGGRGGRPRAATARRARASSARSRRTASSTACACSARASRAAARCSWRACTGRSKEGYDVVNMSLSTTKSQFAATLHDLADSAYFKRSLIVASAHNMPVASYPWRFSSVISVGSHDEPRPAALLLEPVAAGRGLRARRRRRGGVARRHARPLDRQQLRDAAHLRASRR